MNASEGFLTAFGGMTSHAALVARQMGKVCIVGCDAVGVRLPRPHHDGEDRAAGTKVFKEGDWISLDGFTGEVIEGRVRDHAVRGHPGADREEPRRRPRRRSTRTTPS